MPTDKTSDTETVRLNRFLASLGVASRRGCDEMIAAGRVAVDGRAVREPGLRVIPGVNRVSVDKVPVQSPPRQLVLLLNKPAGVVSTVSDPRGRTTVVDLCRRYARKLRLFPVGRLDVNTTGALLLTNDGLLCYRLTHPRFEVPKVYIATVRGAVTAKKLERLEKLALPAGTSRRRDGAVELRRELGRESILKIVLHEGQKHQVRKMCESVGLRIVKLKRVCFGPISIRRLPLGAVRPLEKRELELLKRITSKGRESDGHR